MSKEPTEAATGAKRHGGRYIYEELRKQILTLKLKPGMPLDEVSLAAQFGLFPVAGARCAGPLDQRRTGHHPA